MKKISFIHYIKAIVLIFVYLFLISCNPCKDKDIPLISSSYFDMYIYDADYTNNVSYFDTHPDYFKDSLIIYNQNYEILKSGKDANMEIQVLNANEQALSLNQAISKSFYIRFNSSDTDTLLIKCQAEEYGKCKAGRYSFFEMYYNGILSSSLNQAIANNEESENDIYFVFKLYKK